LTTAVVGTIFCATAFLSVAWHYSTPDIGNPHDMVSRNRSFGGCFAIFYHFIKSPKQRILTLALGLLVGRPGIRLISPRILHHDVSPIPTIMGLSMALVASLMCNWRTLLSRFHSGLPVGSKVLELGSVFYWGYITSRHYVAAIPVGDATCDATCEEEGGLNVKFHLQVQESTEMLPYCL
jgi:hypothetical protein